MIAILLAASAFSWIDAGATDKIALRPAADAVVTGAGLVVFVVPELLKDKLAPAHCAICDGGDNTGLPGTGSRGSLNGVDAYFHDALTGFLLPRKTAETASSVVAFVLVPIGSIAGALTATGPHATDGAGLRATVVVLESSVVSAALIQGVKLVAARKRPFVRYGDGEPSGVYDVNDRDSHLGFPSGHTAFATSMGVAMAMTATLEESPAAPWLWGAAAAMSVTTATLRMIAEKHYFTDVLSSAAVGAACGVVFPLLHRRGSALAASSLSVGAQQGPALTLSGSF